VQEEFAILMNTLGAIFVILYFAGILGLAFNGIRHIRGLGYKAYTWSGRLFGLVMLIGAATATDAAVGRHEWLTLFAAAVVVAILGIFVNNHEDSEATRKRVREVEPDESHADEWGIPVRHTRIG